MSVTGLLHSEALLRTGFFVGAILALLFVQWRWPFRGDGRSLRRAMRNGGLVLVGTVLLRLAFPVLAVAWAMQMEAAGFGFFARFDAPFWFEFVLAVLLLDVAIYWQHRLFHRIPLFWRLHRVHHSDVQFDLTTGVRFHPLELAASMLIKLALIALLAPSPLAVLVFEILLSTGSLFTHSDFALPRGIDRRLRWLFVTPSMHRIHHSIERFETDSNYGFHLSVWDRLFRSYRDVSVKPERSMPIGIGEFRDAADQTLPALLMQPFRRHPAVKEKTDA
jgi:sterol desaturase/sphingolipid hydroxylase (fatty acid hydroxylase superfamily)